MQNVTQIVEYASSASKTAIATLAISVDQINVSRAVAKNIPIAPIKPSVISARADVWNVTKTLIAPKLKLLPVTKASKSASNVLKIDIAQAEKKIPSVLPIKNV
jgi:hypothetical protein